LKATNEAQQQQLEPMLLSAAGGSRRPPGLGGAQTAGGRFLSDVV
jgi:hypothetical protein